MKPRPDQQLDREGISSIYSKHQLVYGIPERPGLMKDGNGRILKIYYRRRGISKASFLPQAQQFISNSQGLLARGLTAPVVESWVTCQEPAVDLITYAELPGTDLRTACEMDVESTLSELAVYLADVHQRGVYFRAIHLGNILKLTDGGMAFLDISDLQLKNKQLRLLLRARNLLHVFKARKDLSYFTHFGINRFLDTYLDATDLSSWGRKVVRNRILIGLRLG